MASRKTEDLRELDLTELNARLVDAEEALANLQFQLGSGQLENTGSVKFARREVARIMTLIREQEKKTAAEAGAVEGGSR